MLQSSRSSRDATLCSALALAVCLAAASCSAPPPATATATASETSRDTPAAASGSRFPARPLWGDTHLHTRRSYDAFAAGNTLSAADAFRLALGEEVTSSTGVKTQLSRPLDFLAIADHAEGFGIMDEIASGNPVLTADDRVAAWSQMMATGREGLMRAGGEIIGTYTAGTTPPILADVKALTPIVAANWAEHVGIVEAYNRPGEFTALNAYEYSPMPEGDNLHRVVVFRDGPERVTKTLPFPSTISNDVEALWAALGAYEQSTGGRVLAMPHNGNLSNGLMFALTDYGGDPIDSAYAATRARWEPVVEATQMKGDSESHPYLSPNDEYAGFGDRGWDEWNLFASKRMPPETYAGSYVREALKRGLALERQTGVNPYRFGLIGSTDSHTGLSQVEETDFTGKWPASEEAPERRSKTQPSVAPTDRATWNYLSSGYAAVWATENTREGIFDALARRECYASTGPRITARVFGGWDFAAGDLTGDGAAAGYARGVPMGGVLPPRPSGATAPTFMLSARMDPAGARLDRIQVIKGYIDAAGQTHERIYTPAWSDDQPVDAKGAPPARHPGAANPDGLTPAPGGAAELSAVWTDPDFDATQASFYYARVIEVETPRWTAYDRAKYGGEPAAGDDEVTRERAYTSPIWYEPGR